jgi:hypothetical protein
MAAQLSNDDFLKVLLRRSPEGHRIWVTSFPQDPEHGDWRGEPYEPAKTIEWNSAANNYFSIGTVKPGVNARKKENFGALLAVVLDDIGTKVPASATRPKPTWALETSPRNFQFGYLLRDAISDKSVAERLIGGLTGKGLTDPGASGIIRYTRLPVGSNSKKKHVEANKGNPWRTELTTWEPDRLYTAQELAEVFDISLSQQRGRPADNPAAIRAEGDPFFRLLDQLGVLTGRSSPDGWHGMTCPWENEHTTADGGTSCAYKPGGGWKCLHGHCASRRFNDVLAWVREEHKVDTDAVLREMPGATGALARGVDRYVYAKDVEAFVDLTTATIDSKTSLDDSTLV